jgi:hypothetical protein
MHTASSPGSTVEPIKAHTIRQVRLRVPDPLYRTLRHRLADCGPETSISDLVVELIEKALGQATSQR